MIAKTSTDACSGGYTSLRIPWETEDQETLALLRSLHPEVDQAYELVQQFAHMLRTRTGEQLENWLQRVRTSKIRELQGFVAGIERDKAAVIAGLTLPQNNGVGDRKHQQTETPQANDVRQSQISEARVSVSCMLCNPPFSAGATRGAFPLTGGSYKLMLHQMCVRLTKGIDLFKHLFVSGRLRQPFPDWCKQKAG
ncbi:MAG TPA: transposase [Ktedonobacteraceae bacterium]|nr:transposase [Ktedonobacteraceae bacterium]